MFNRFSLHLLLAALTFLGSSLALRAAEPVPPQNPSSTHILATLRTGHPRVLLTPEKLTWLKSRLDTDPQLHELFLKLRAQADESLASPMIKYELVGPRLLRQSNKCLNDVSLCSLMYLLTKEDKYAQRAIDVMKTAASFQDWHPPHFLDVAQMSLGVALGYDWLFDRITPEDRTLIRNAIVKHALLEGKACYLGGVRHGWWVGSDINWNLWCNSGLTAAALSVADEEPEIASFIIESSIKSAPKAIANWRDDGGWIEGIGYGSGTMTFMANYVSALESALGTSFDLLASPGIANAGLFRIYHIGPTDKTFCYSDADEIRGSSPGMFFLAQRFNRPLYAWHHRGDNMISVNDLLWYNSEGSSELLNSLPLDKPFTSIHTAFFRTAWNDPNATWLAIRGGDTGATHAHLDIGTFALDSLGQRWIVELGMDDYNLPNYKNCYRRTTQGSNTLMIDGANQPDKAVAPLTSFTLDPHPRAQFDLSHAYPMMKSVTRIAERNGEILLLTDRFESDRSHQIIWQAHTRAEVSGATTSEIQLKQNDQTYTISIKQPVGATFTVEDVDPPPELFRRSLKGIRKIMIKLPDVSTGAITVEFKK